MSLTKSVVSKPVTVLIVFMIMVGLGLYSAKDLAIDLYPNIDIPTLIVMCSNNGVTPQEIEKSITRTLESSLSSVSGINKISSTSAKSDSTITLEFKYGTNMDEAVNSVREKIDMVKRYLPENADTPMIFKFDLSSIPIMYIALRGNRTPEELKQIGDDIVAPRLEQVDGVATASVSGGRTRMIRVEIPQNRLNAYNMTLTQISSKLSGQNIQIAAGSIAEGNKNYLVQTSGEYKSIEEIKNTIIDIRNDNKIKLSDIANVYDGFEDESSLVYLNGEPGVQVILQKQSGSNSVKAADNVKERMKKLEKDLPKGVHLDIVWDSTVSIKNSINEVTSSAIQGGILAVLILFIFLRNFKSVFIIAISIPLSIIITLFFMNLFGLTLNLMTLAGLALGIGMLVDNSIVILENIFRYREKGTKHLTASILGSQEMITAIMASTLTTICVFLPMVIFRSTLEVIGELMSALAFTIVFSLTSSILVAVFLVPVLTSRYLKIQNKSERVLKEPFKTIDLKFEMFFTWLDDKYKSALRFVLGKRKIVVLSITGIFVLSIISVFLVGFIFTPKAEGDSVIIEYELPIGTKLEVTKDITKQLEMIIQKEIRGYKNITSIVGVKGFMGFLGSSETHKAEILITLPEFSKRIDSESIIKEKIRKHFNDFPSVIFNFSSGGMSMGGGSSPIDIIIKSNDMDKAFRTAEKIRDIIKSNVPEATEPAVDMKSGLPQVEIFIDRDKAYSLGLNVYTIGAEVQANIDGITSSKFKDGGKEYDIIVILQNKDRDALPDLDKIFVLNATGKRIPLSNFAHYEKTFGPTNIKREDQMRTVHVTAGLLKGAKLDKVISDINKQIDKKIAKDDEVLISFGGDFADLMKLGLNTLIILLISVFLVFGVMASQFESFLDPFIILFTIPLMFIGVAFIYIVTFETFSIFTAVGLVVLSGIVVNNGIVLVDYTNLLRKRGMNIKDACVEAGGNRLRPILMTTLTTILGLIPMAFSKGEGSSLSQPIAKTLLGGLTFSTIFTLFLIPVLYSIFNEFSEKRKLKKAIKRERKLRLNIENAQQEEI